MLNESTDIVTKAFNIMTSCICFCLLCSVQPLSSEENCHSAYSSQSDSQYGSPPRGWSEELDEHGHTLYVSDYTQEKVQFTDSDYD